MDQDSLLDMQYDDYMVHDVESRNNFVSFNITSKLVKRPIFK